MDTKPDLNSAVDTNVRTMTAESAPSPSPDPVPHNIAQLSLSDLFVSNESLRSFLRLSCQFAWEFDSKKRTFTFFGETKNVATNSFAKPVTPDDLIDGGFVHPSDLPAFRRFLESLLSGEKQGSTLLLLRLFDEKTYAWYSLSYQMLTDENGQPNEAVGTLSHVNGIHRGILAYRQSFESITSDSYASLGVLVAAVPRLLALENVQGPEHCNTVLRFLREQLSQCFDNSIVINTYDQEFVVLSPNVAEEVFLDSVTQVRQLCNRSYADQIAFGSVWSNGKFIGSALVPEARAIMLSQSEERPKSAEIVKPPRILNVHIPINQFTVFYQPKVDMQTKRIVGAEALVRGIDNEGNLQPPGNFIGILEHEGQLRTLDMFVLSRVLQQLSQWKRTGKRLFPISVNFSRYTLFDESTLGTVLALLKNYDEIDSSLLEFEITEKACSVDAEKLKQTMKPYQEHGIRFALDDFGTGSIDLSLFSDVHFTTIKLDRALIEDLNGNASAASLVEKVVRIAYAAKTSVVAEGVDKYDLTVDLMQRGCRYAQGYFYEKPLEAKKFSQKYLEQ